MLVGGDVVALVEDVPENLSIRPVYIIGLFFFLENITVSKKSS